MQIDLNDVAPRLKWNLEIKVGDILYRIRPWTLRDTQMLSLLSGMGEEEGYAWILSLFEGDAPDVREWDEDRASTFVGAVLGYKSSLAQKKTQEAMERTRKLAANL